MKTKQLLQLNAAVFGLVALVHLLRIFNKWEMQLGNWSAPQEASWLGVLIAGALCYWNYNSGSK